MPERLDQIKIAMTHGPDATLEWQARTALLNTIARSEEGRPIRSAFEAVGATRPVDLDLPQKKALLRMIDDWSVAARDGTDGLPEGIFELRNALLDDLRDPEPTP